MNSEQDRHIQTVLHAIGHTGPRPEMQARLLDALRRAEPAERPSAKLRRWLLAAWPAVPRFAAAALLLAAGLSLQVHRSNRTSRLTPAYQSPGKLLRSSNSSRSDAMAGPADSMAKSSGLAVLPTSTLRLTHKRAVTAPVSSSPTARLAVREEPSGRSTSTDNLPPPPEPLTAQERLLLRLARREPPRQLAQLTTTAADGRFQHGRDAVTEFFLPPPQLRSQQGLYPAEPTGQQ